MRLSLCVDFKVVPKKALRKLLFAKKYTFRGFLGTSWGLPGGLLGPLHYLVLHNWMEISIVKATSLGSPKKDARMLPESVSFL